MSKKLRTKTPNQQEDPHVFHYRMLRSSLLFAFIWIISAVAAFIVIWYFDFKLNSEEGLTLIIASLLSLVLAFHSLEQRGSPYVYLYDDRIKIHYSFLRDVTIQYHNLGDINVVNEELELDLPVDRTETIGALLLGEIGRLPKSDKDKASATFGNVELKAVKVSDKRIENLLLKIL